MTDANYHDGIYEIANRTNASAGRSYHIPAKPSRLAFYVRTGVQFGVVAGVVAVIWIALT
jgi:hypothetical protein